ncbi:hypothetical protein [Faecalibaculum rodentium]|jgi:hypothetical protein|uniref:Uncharacterized protein n=1 Tax=Faecalibaculum rodentium TaxID=1702221 RepID=A0A140DYR5_9FIRM|nr:hypothetical protein [Faecalibaculum rodentium]AMK55792.1 hypothetical protein AALO17_26580 [Faecalibaculum rodentium]
MEIVFGVLIGIIIAMKDEILGIPVFQHINTIYNRRSWMQMLVIGVFLGLLGSYIIMTNYEETPGIPGFVMISEQYPLLHLLLDIAVVLIVIIITVKTMNPDTYRQRGNKKNRTNGLQITKNETADQQVEPRKRIHLVSMISPQKLSVDYSVLKRFLKSNDEELEYKAIILSYVLKQIELDLQKNSEETDWNGELQKLKDPASAIELMNNVAEATIFNCFECSPRGRRESEIFLKRLFSEQLKACDKSLSTRKFTDQVFFLLMLQFFHEQKNGTGKASALLTCYLDMLGKTVTDGTASREKVARSYIAALHGFTALYVSQLFDEANLKNVKTPIILAELEYPDKEMQQTVQRYMESGLYDSKDSDAASFEHIRNVYEYACRYILNTKSFVDWNSITFPKKGEEYGKQVRNAVFNATLFCRYPSELIAILERGLV